MSAFYHSYYFYIYIASLYLKENIIKNKALTKYKRTTMAQFAVIGLGSFGATVAQELTRLNHDVIGIDTVKRMLRILPMF